MARHIRDTWACFPLAGIWCVEGFYEMHSFCGNRKIVMGRRGFGAVHGYGAWWEKRFPGDRAHTRQQPPAAFAVVG
jgi:hypothetical protein